VYCACINPDASYLKQLIDTNAYIHSGDSDQRRPIHYAAACEGPEPLKLLLSVGANLSEVDHQQKNCLHIASITGRAENIRTILYADPTLVGSKDIIGMTPIGYACKFGHLEAVEVLLEFGASVNGAVGP
jgi:ankyrin repeat protein